MIYLSQLLSPKELTSTIHNYQVGLELIDFSVGMNLDCMSKYLEYWRSVLSQLQNPALTLHGPFLDLNPIDVYKRQLYLLTFYGLVNKNSQEI